MFDDDEQEDTHGVYGDGGREDLMGNDEISPEEDAFMSGYDTEEEHKENVEDIYEKAFDATVGIKGKRGKVAKKAVKKKAKPAKIKKANPKKATKKAKPTKKSSKKAAKKAKPKKATKKAKPTKKSKKKSKR